MSRSRRTRARQAAAAWDRLEARQLLDAGAGLVPGNAGYVRRSQFQATGFGEVGNQWWQLAAGGPVSVHFEFGGQAGAGATAPGIYTPPANVGNIITSQFNDKGFSLVGTQLRQVTLGGGLTIDAHDETLRRPSAGPAGGILGAPTNSGDVVRSQFNDSGFGNIGLQWRRVSVGGDLSIRTQTFLRPPHAAGGVAAAAQAAAATPARATRGPANINTNLIRDTQFNDGGFGDVGFQLRQVRIGGSAGVGMERWLIQEPDTDSGGHRPPRPVHPGRPERSENATNTGEIVRSQFSDGGFGDVGAQWSRVAVGRDVLTSYNTLSIQPKRDDTAAITAEDLAFGRGHPSTTVAAAQATAVDTGSSSALPLSATAAGDAFRPTQNDATNSGLILHSQFSDGGFGDIGLQWRRVRVGGAVTAVHNSLSVQPENHGQGFITVRNVYFPSDPAPLPPPHHGPRHVISPTPPLVERDGAPVTTPLPRRTRPFDTSFPKNYATNSGDVRGSQFSDGGFGDIGLQWEDVSARKDVRLIHNSLSVHPEGSGLQGIRVSNVAFAGPPGSGPGAAPGVSASAAGGASTICAAAAGSDDGKACHDHTGPTNDRILIFKQFTDSTEADVFLQWDGVTRRFGLVVVNNMIEVDSGASVTLEDIHFPGEDPPLAVRPGAGVSSTPAAPTAGQGILNSATNSGIISHNQFSDGGLGDIGLQWRNVKVTGPVTVVHNTLSVDAVGTDTGPITIENVAFQSGALGTGSTLRSGHAIVAPPPVLSRIVARRVARSLALPHDPDVDDKATNSGILFGGQFTAGCLGHVALQWRGVRIHGPVTVVDNVLSVKTASAAAGPITIRHVAFE